MSQVIVRKERRVIIIQGHYKNDQEHESFIQIRRQIVRYFASIIGGAFDSTEIIQITNESHSLEKLNDTINNLPVDVAIFVFLGHGATQDGKQIFQFSETEVIYPGQLNYKAKNILVLVDSCRGHISGCEMMHFSNKIPSFVDGGKFLRKTTREMSKDMYYKAIDSVKDGITICFACNEGEFAYGFQFLNSLVDKSNEMGIKSKKVIFIRELMPVIHDELCNKSSYSQNPVITSTNTDFPIAVPAFISPRTD